MSVVAPPGGGTSAPVVRTTGPEVMGDGTTARTRAVSRWRRLRVLAVIAVLVVAAGVLASVLTPPRSTLPLAPDNPESTGSRAAAEILGRQGVDVVHARTFADADAASGPGTTLLVTSTHLLDPEQVDGLVATGADLVLVEPDWGTLTTATDERLDTRWAEPYDGTVDAQCADADAEAAGRLAAAAEGGVAAVPGADGVTVCFPLPDDPEAGLYAVADLGDRRVAVLGDSDVMTNDRLDEEGNAALVLRALGRHATLVWYQPTFGDTGGTGSGGGAGGPALGEVLPTWAGPLALQLALVVLVVALWRGRAFGRVVTEPLPVRVRATETVLGRGRLYRRTRSRGHAAAALRAGAARRTAARLGLPRSAGAADVIDALARATGRDGRQVGALLYGPPPTDDAGLLELARQLDELESEVHRS